MKVLILGGSNSRNSGGVFNSARSLGLNLNKLYNVDIHCLMHDDEYSAEDRKFYTPLPLHTYSLKGPSNLGFSTDMYEIMSKIQPDIVHTQCIWMYLSKVNRDYNKKKGTPYIIAPRGMLDVWQLKQSVWKKQLALALYERKHLANADCLHALCKEEHDAMRAFNLTNPIAIIPNGIHLPVIPESHNRVRWQTHGNRKTLLFLSRIHSKKGLDNLLEAWALTRPQSHNWQLVIAGETKDTLYMETLVSASKRLHIEDTVQFIGGQFGEDKQACFIHADAFVLPSFSEGLPMAVLEAWSYKVPVVMTDYCNIPEGFVANAAVRVETNADSIASGLNTLFNMPVETMVAMGNNGYNLVKEKFTWQQIAGSTLRLYNWVTGNGERPDFVY